jgi:hypothetical protein
VPRKCKALSSKLSSALILQKRIFIFWSVHICIHQDFFK